MGFKRNAAVPFDTPDCDPALEGEFACDAVEIGADGQCWRRPGSDGGDPSFAKLIAHMRNRIPPEWAAGICDVPAATMRRIANEYLDHAQVGATIEIEGKRCPTARFPVSLGKTVNNGWGGFECCWARTLLATLVGGLEVPGGTLGTTVRLNRPLSERLRAWCRGRMVSCTIR